MTHPELNAAREGLYRLLSRLYRQEVDAPLLERLRGMTFPQTCPQPELEAGYRALERWLSAGTEDALDALAVDFARVFLGAGSAEGCAAFPYESVYTSPKRLVMQDAWERVKSLYAAHGVRIDTDSSELMEDHIAYELAYMALLCREGAERAEQRAFLEEHLLTWVPDFCADLQRCAGTGFYRCVAQLTLGWLKLEEGLLQAEENAPSPFSCRVSTPALDRILEALGKEYRIYAPKRFPGRGARAGSDLVRYAPIRSAAEIVTDAPSDFSAKEIFYPVNQTMLYFQDDACRESVLSDQREILIFARPCDINAVRRLDQIFLGNGGEQDVYYRRLREKVRFLLLECGGSADSSRAAPGGEGDLPHLEAVGGLTGAQQTVAVGCHGGSGSRKAFPVGVRSGVHTGTEPSGEFGDGAAAEHRPAGSLLLGKPGKQPEQPQNLLFFHRQSSFLTP